MKQTSQASFLHNNMVLGFANKIKGEYIMQFIRDISYLQLNTLAKLTKNIKI